MGLSKPYEEGIWRSQRVPGGCDVVLRTAIITWAPIVSTQVVGASTHFERPSFIFRRSPCSTAGLVWSFDGLS